jgi:hypothetical protein
VSRNQSHTQSANSTFDLNPIVWPRELPRNKREDCFLLALDTLVSQENDTSREELLNYLSSREDNTTNNIANRKTRKQGPFVDFSVPPRQNIYQTMPENIFQFQQKDAGLSGISERVPLRLLLCAITRTAIAMTTMRLTIQSPIAVLINTTAAVHRRTKG